MSSKSLFQSILSSNHPRSTMHRAHIPLFMLLVYLTGSVESYAWVTLDVTSTRSNIADRFFLCLSRNATTAASHRTPRDHCIKYYSIWTWTATQLVDAHGKPMHLVDEPRRIDEPWQSEMYLLIWNTNGHAETIDVSHLTVRSGTMEDIKILGLSLSFRLMCEHKFFGPQCTDGCDEESAEGAYKCDQDDGHRICLGNRFGEFCDEPLCLHDSTYLSGNCICLPGWTGNRCDQVDCSSSDCHVTGHDDDVESTNVKNMVNFTLILLLLTIALAFSMLFVVLALRRARQLRKPIVADSLKSSHYLLTIEDEYPSSISDQKLVE
ncbi:hypothetical protein PRIPAC_76481 [Pristionchus pacificus]|nr:hypothetical protein PRIPAC_76481 [Pristionchus pacificus]